MIDLYYLVKTTGIGEIFPIKKGLVDTNPCTY